MQDYDYRPDRSSCPSCSPIGRSTRAAIHASRLLVSGGPVKQCRGSGPRLAKEAVWSSTFGVGPGVLCKGSKSARWNGINARCRGERRRNGWSLAAERAWMSLRVRRPSWLAVGLDSHVGSCLTSSHSGDISTNVYKQQLTFLSNSMAVPVLNVI